MKFNAEHPFDGYVAYLRISKSKKSNSIGRKIIGLYAWDKKPRRLTMSYARYLLCVKEGRVLTKEEQADHKDGDKTNDDINNLQILSSTGNNRKRVNETGKNRMMVTLECPVCKNNFTKEKNKTFLIKEGFYSTCSLKCNHKMQTIKAGWSKKQLILIGKKQIIKLFRADPYKDIK